MKNNNERKYYIYAWYYINTNKIFHIGKGCGERYKDTECHRNKYFKNVIAKEGNNVDVKKLYENLTEDEAWDLERKLIHEYWDRGECKTNFHEGGRGGNHGNYGESFRRKISEFAKTRIGIKNPMYGKIQSEEGRKRISEAAKRYHKEHPLSEDHKRKMIENSVKFWTSEEGSKKRSLLNKTRKRSESYLRKNRDRQCPHNFILKLNDKVLFETRYRKDLIKFCEETLHISRTIFFQVLNGSWVPKFKKHQHLKNLQIIVEQNKFIKSVSTNPDECKGVE